MQEGWYSHIQETTSVAYFDGTAWEPLTDRSALPQGIQRTITPLDPGHPGPHAPFETVPVAGPRTPVETVTVAAPGKNTAGLGWLVGIVAGVLMIVWGIMHGFANAGRNCGAPFKENSVAEYMDALAQDYGLGRTTYAADCKESIASATVWVWVLILIGVLVILGSAIIVAILRSAHASRAAIPAAKTAPTAASQIEELARLRDKGLVTPEEFEWKKQDLLRRS